MINVQSLYDLWHRDGQSFLCVLNVEKLMKRKLRLSIGKVYDLLGGNKLPYKRG